jgi:hypothetical protein
VYASDYDLHRTQRFESGYYPMVTSAGYGIGNTSQQLAFPSGCWADDMGNVIVADTYNHRVMLWDEGAYDGQVLVGGGGAPSEVDLFFPYDVTVDFAGRMYVADSHHHRVLQWPLAHGLTDSICPGGRCVSCTLGNLCTLTFDAGILVTSEAAVMILDEGECGDSYAKPMQFFSRDNGTDFPTYFNPQRVSQEGREFRSFSLGNAFVAPPRVAYDLCWSRNYTKWFKKQKPAILAGKKRRWLRGLPVSTWDVYDGRSDRRRLRLHARGELHRQSQRVRHSREFHRPELALFPR